MNSDTESPTLGEHFAVDALAGAITKKWSGGYEVRALNVMIASMWVFQKGAVLGRARSDRILALATLVAVEGGGERMVDHFKSVTEKLLSKYGKEPTSFRDFLQKTIFPGMEMGNADTLKALHNKKYRLGEYYRGFKVM
jgi:hypothetical protein